jgi:hypothetical protein
MALHISASLGFRDEEDKTARCAKQVVVTCEHFSISSAYIVGLQGKIFCRALLHHFHI